MQSFINKMKDVYKRQSPQSSTTDYDNDGDLDVLHFCSGHFQFYRYDGGTTYSSTPDYTTNIRSGSALWFDYNKDVYKRQIECSLDNNSDVLIEIVNATGQKTAMFSYDKLSAGAHQIKLSAIEMNIPDGLCYVRIIAGQKISVLKCNYIR